MVRLGWVFFEAKYKLVNELGNMDPEFGMRLVFLPILLPVAAFITNYLNSKIAGGRERIENRIPVYLGYMTFPDVLFRVLSRMHGLKIIMDVILRD
ncbi:MAG: hypothetical protein ACLU4N_13810 [Butyricimonas faecihominis]